MSMASAYLPQVDRSLFHTSHTATRATSRSPSPTPDSKERHEEILSAEQGVNSRLAVDFQEQDFLCHTNRGDHLPSRGAHAERARGTRNMYGYAPIGSMYDAQGLSSEEEKWELKKSRLANFGKRHFIKFGSTRTLQELENSIEESQAQQQPPADDSDMSDAEGGPGVFIGGHTGHAAANLAAQRRAQQEESVRATQAAQRATAAQRAAQGGPAAPPTIGGQVQTNAVPPDDVPQDPSFEQRDMDADVEDLDED